MLNRAATALIPLVISVLGAQQLRAQSMIQQSITYSSAHECKALDNSARSDFAAAMKGDRDLSRSTVSALLKGCLDDSTGRRGWMVVYVTPTRPPDGTSSAQTILWQPEEDRASDVVPGWHDGDPGSGSLSVVFLSTSARTSIETIVSETRQPNSDLDGVAAQASKVFATASGALAPLMKSALMIKAIGFDGSEPPSNTATHVFARVASVPIRWEHSKLAFKHAVSPPASAEAKGPLIALDSALAKLRRPVATVSGCLRAYLAAAEPLLRAKATSDGDTAKKKSPDELKKGYNEVLDAATLPAVCGTPTDSERAAVAAAIESLRNIWEPGKPTTGTFVLRNIPEVRWHFSSIVGAQVGGAAGATPVAVSSDGKKYISSPVAAAMTMVAVSLHPWHFDSTTTAVSWAERFAVFGGATITPYFGLGGGVSAGIIRNFGLAVGYHWLYVPTTVGSRAVGDSVPPTGPTLSRGFTGVAFVGGTFGFK